MTLSVKISHAEGTPQEPFYCHTTYANGERTPAPAVRVEAGDSYIQHIWPGQNVVVTERNPDGGQ